VEKCRDFYHLQHHVRLCRSVGAGQILGAGNRAASDRGTQPGYADSAVGDSRPRLYFVKVPEGKIVKNRVHLDIMPNDRTQDEEIARLIRLGAIIVSDRRPDVGWVIMADPGGNEFCVEISRAELDAALAAESSG
jgi:hypothetical protein